jgi:hypothetical protein
VVALLADKTTRPGAIRLYADVDLVSRAEYAATMIVPLLEATGVLVPDREARWADCREIVLSLFSLSPLADCDYAVLPFPWELALARADLRRAAEALVLKARQAGKEVLIFREDDSSDHVELSEVVIFQTSLDRTRARPNEFPQPAWAEDLLAQFTSGELRLRKKRDHPVVGFCGYAPPHGMPRGTTALREQFRYHLGRSSITTRLAATVGVSTAMNVRARAIATLSREPAIETNFIFRSRAFADAQGNVGAWYTATDYRAEYVENTLSSDYVLCARGWGNYSYRLYETLCLGRVPILIDTDCVWPAADAVDWPALCLIVAEQDLPQIGDALLDFHASISSDDFITRQRRAREVWTSTLSTAGFLRYLASWLRQRMTNKREA